MRPEQPILGQVSRDFWIGVAIAARLAPVSVAEDCARERTVEVAERIGSGPRGVGHNYFGGAETPQTRANNVKAAGLEMKYRFFQIRGCEHVVGVEAAYIFSARVGDAEIAVVSGQSRPISAQHYGPRPDQSHC